MRDYLVREVQPADVEERRRVIQAFVTVSEYRGMHGRPMASVTMGIRSMVKTARRDDTIRPGQRFKRLDRIISKLVRFPRMRLSQMEDIGGCRVVLPTLDEVYDVLSRVRHNWPEAAITDYIAAPKADGYRGVHVVKRRDGRLVEVQLRTVGQHDWAETIELFSPRVGFGLKDGEGPADLREYFKQAAERIARGERGEDPDPVAESRFATLRQQVLPYFENNQ
jgi:putative GTP pyrophosphokinase